jgi:SAM-dependent methyltransferase
MALDDTSRVNYDDPGKIFTSTADSYVQFRPRHPNRLLDYFAHLSSDVDSDSPVLDLGCGPGVIAIRMAELGLPVLAVDPSAEMLNAGRARADREGVTGITWHVADSTTLDQLPDPQVRSAIIGDAFHYMDRPQTLRALHRLIVPGGRVGIVVSRTLGAPVPYWETVLNEIRDRHLGTHRQAGPQEMFTYLDVDHETVLRRSAFSTVTTLNTDVHLDLTLDQILGIQRTYAFSSDAVLGDRKAAFERDIATALTAINPSGRFTATQQSQIIIGERG